jgi:hypothetical protein
VFGVCGVAIKHNLDRFTAAQFGYPWHAILSYWIPVIKATRLTELTPDEKRFLAVLFLTTIPFLWVGVTLTVKRLRDAGQPLWLTVLFFVPVVNVVFFVLLCLMPSQDASALMQATGGRQKSVSGYWPSGSTGSAAIAAAAAGLLGTLVTWGALRYVGVYGLTLFITLPFLMGYLSVFLYSRTQPVTSMVVLRVVSFALLLAGAGIAAIAVEGVVCLLMAAPLAWLVAIFGGTLAMAIHGREDSPEAAPSLYAVVLVLPVLLGLEHAARPPVPRFQVQTSIEIEAPPEVVWQRIIQFPALPPAKDWPFNFGIAYPIEARIMGEGLTAQRECRFSTGSFKEPILAWEPDKHFAFAVVEEPVLMQETSPYKNIHVRHLEDHDFQPERADFVLVTLPNGGTRLEGTTTYTNKMWPALYWRLWTDAIVHRIHLRVFEHVKGLAEGDVRAERRNTGSNLAGFLRSGASASSSEDRLMTSAARKPEGVRYSFLAALAE